MKKFLIGLIIAGSAVALGAVVSKLLKSKNSDNSDYDEDDYDYDYPEEFDDDEEDIAIDDCAGESDENCCPAVADEDAETPAEDTADADEETEEE